MAVASSNGYVNMAIRILLTHEISLRSRTISYEQLASNVLVAEYGLSLRSVRAPACRRGCRCGRGDRRRGWRELEGCYVIVLISYVAGLVFGQYVRLMRIGGYVFRMLEGVQERTLRMVFP